MRKSKRIHIEMRKCLEMDENMCALRRKHISLHFIFEHTCDPNEKEDQTENEKSSKFIYINIYCNAVSLSPLFLARIHIFPSRSQMLMNIRILVSLKGCDLKQKIEKTKATS